LSTEEDNMDFKFALRDFSGKPVSYYIARQVKPPTPIVEKTVAHHVVIVDRSGSMYGVMNETKAMVEKVMTIEEYKDSELLLSLISYSSEGDVTTHFERRKVSEILTPGSVEIESLRKIRPLR
jgi:predicted metal-dependent peptidase